MARKTSKRKLADMDGAADAPTNVDTGVVIQLAGLVNEQPHALDGQYVVRYHPGPASFRRGEALLVTTRDINKAKVYGSHAEAHSEWMRIDQREPARPNDGKPNRPMTAWHILIIPAPKSDS